MTIDLSCQRCESSFELDANELMEGTEKLACPNCHAKAPSDLAEDFTAALAEMIQQVGVLSKKFSVSLTVESEDLLGTADEIEEDDDEDDGDEEGDEDADEGSEDYDADEDGG